MRMVPKEIQIFLIKEIEILLNLCRDSSVKGEYGRTHIFKVWLSNPTVDLLLREEADVVNICNNRGISPLHLAELIESVIGKGFDFKNEVHGFPLLHQFVNIHFVSGVELLLKKGADLNYQDKEGRSPLHIAVCRQYIDITQMLLNKGAVVDIRNEEGETPLFCAVNMKLLFRQGANVNLKCHVCRPLHRDAVKMNEDIFDALLNHGANINERDGSGNTILHAAAARGFIYGIKTCLTRGVKVNERNFGGETPLHLAKSKEICEILLDSGALLEARDFSECTPFLTAAKCKYYTLDYLLQRGAEVNVRDNRGESALIAVQEDVEKVQTILDYGGDVNIKDNKGNTPLHILIDRQFGSKCIELLLERQAGVNIKNNAGLTPLHLAVLNNRTSVIELLLDNGADVFLINKRNKSPLQLALTREAVRPEISVMLDKGTMLNFRDRDTNSPLHFAVSNGDYDLVKALIDNGACVNSENSKCQSPLHIAVSRSFEPIVQLLLEKEASVNVGDAKIGTPLHLAVLVNNKTLIKALIDKGADVNNKDNQGSTPLHYAILCTNFEVSILLIHKSNVNLVDKCYRTPLHLAVLYEFDAVVDPLLASGAKVNLSDKKRNTPLHYASQNVSELLTRKLLERGALIDIQNSKGQTPLHVVIEQWSLLSGIECVRVLLDYGAAMDIKDYKGKTPIEYRKNVMEMKDLFSEMIIKSECVNLELYLNNEVVSALLKSYSELVPFQTTCLTELKYMKTQKIGSNNLYDVFSHYRDPTFSMKQSMEETINSPTLDLEFPLYAPLLRVTFERAKARHKLLDLAVENVSAKIDITLPNEVKRHIMSYLSDRELKTLLNK